MPTWQRPSPRRWGAPEKLAKDAQAATGIAHLQTALGVLRQYSFRE